MTGPPVMFVDRASATDDCPWKNNDQHVLPLNRKHSEQVKILDCDDDYIQVACLLLEFMGVTENVVRARFLGNINQCPLKREL